MSSEDDEFFDAPEAFGCAYYSKKWSDNEDELVDPSFDFESKNARRRSRVESLKKQLYDKNSTHTYTSGHSQYLGRDEVQPDHLNGNSIAYLFGISSGDAQIDADKSKSFGPRTSTREGIDITDAMETNSVRNCSFSQRLSVIAHPKTDTGDSVGQLQLPSIHTHSDQLNTVMETPSIPQLPDRLSSTINVCSCLHRMNSALGASQPPVYDLMNSYVLKNPANVDPAQSALPNNPLRSQVISSAPEVSGRIVTDLDQNAKDLFEYVKSWSLDAARQHVISQSCVQNLRLLPNELSGPPLDLGAPIATAPAPSAKPTENFQTDLFCKQHTQQIPNLHNPALIPFRTRPDQPNILLNSTDLGALFQPSHPGCLLNPECCLHRSSCLISSIIPEIEAQTIYPDSQNGQLCNTILSNSVSSLPADRLGTTKSASATLANNERTLNPIEAQFRDRTKSNSSLPFISESIGSTTDTSTIPQLGNTTFTGKMTKFHKYVRGAVSAFKSATRTKIFNPDEVSSDEDEEVIGNQGIRLRSSRQARGRREFLQIKLVQEMKNEHTGAIWAMRFSPCGRLLATAGYDRNIRIWVLRQWYNYFKRMQQCSVAPSSSSEFKTHPFIGNDFQMTTSNALDEEIPVDSVSLASTSVSTSGRTDDGGSSCSSIPASLPETHLPNPDKSLPNANSCKSTSNSIQPADLESGRGTVFRSRPLLVLRGHDGVVTELAWSRNLFLLATSMDHQVRLWHISRRECLCVFSHNDTVPTIVFHPKDDRYFLSGSLDGKLRLWNIPDKKVRFWVEVPMPSALPVPNLSSSSSNPTVSSLFGKFTQSSSTPLASSSSTSTYNLSSALGPKTVITCAAFACEGTKIVVGTYDGRVLFFNSELSYITFIAIKSGTTKVRHCRVTAIELDPTDSNKILLTSNDSRLRLVDARDYHTLCKYRGFVNETSQIRASFSPTGRYLISGSENSFFYIWQKSLEVERVSRFSRIRKDRNNCWEAIKAHDTMVTVAQFSPNPNLVLNKRKRKLNATSLTPTDLELTSPSTQTSQLTNPYLGEIVVSADCNGCIRVFKNQCNDSQSTTIQTNTSK